ncbi:DHA2 family efflux MFS transporter permease subunit [Leucobacter sp. M11]|uniref:DHA2 family efflux MFS transporter permease subunit n=1 Tax=Leucobacter sp. M11 TaxID=2993565 RepID=UPI002D7E2CAA|nr:DHA2 family efflux MFS transporter permease subunit [Leucobacter sp. M11]MEB4614437.1 DHA2 family efflux MFS transporter permease subunit [Leucobacter sp. M11]
MSETTKRRPVWLVLVAVSLPMFMAALDNLVVTNALPVIRAEFGASLEELTWMVNAYTLSFASLILMASALADRFGRRRVFAIGLVVFTLASLACGFSDEAWMLIVARAIQGAGGAALMPLSLTLLSTSVPERVRPAAIGIWGGISGLGVALGPLIGGAVVEGLNWQAIFWLNVPIGLICLPLIRYALPESRGRVQRLDFVGLLLAGLGVFALVFGIVRGNDAGWTSAEVLVPLIGGAILLLAFVWWETRVTAPLLPLRLFRNRSFTAANLVGVVFSLGVFGAVFILIQFLQLVQGASPLHAGVMTMPWTMAPLLVAPLTGLITPRVGTRPVIVAGLACMTAGLIWIAAVLDPRVAYPVLVPPFVLAGIGMGLVFAPLATAVLDGMAPEDQATASGTNSTAREIGVALGIATLTAIFTAAGGELTPTGFTDAAVPAIIVGGIALAIATLIGCAIPKRRPTQPEYPRADASPHTRQHPDKKEGAP